MQCYQETNHLIMNTVFPRQLDLIIRNRKFEIDLCYTICIQSDCIVVSTISILNRTVGIYCSKNSVSSWIMIKNTIQTLEILINSLTYYLVFCLATFRLTLCVIWILIKISVIEWLRIFFDQLIIFIIINIDIIFMSYIAIFAIWFNFDENDFHITNLHY